MNLVYVMGMVLECVEHVPYRVQGSHLEGEKEREKDGKRKGFRQGKKLKDFLFVSFRGVVFTSTGRGGEGEGMRSGFGQRGGST